MRTMLLAALCALVTQDRPTQGGKPTVAPPYDREKLERAVDDLATKLVAEEGVPGLTIAIADGDDVFYAKGFGYADAEHARPAKATTRYPLGTLTRQFTAVAILQLVDAKKLKLDDPIETYLPEFPRENRSITLAHLLSNTSGIPGYAKVRAKHEAVPTDEKGFFAQFEGVPFDFEPGADFSLDSANYALLSMIVARVSKTPYTQYVREKILEPLGLTETGFCPRQDFLPGFARDCKSEWTEADFELPSDATKELHTQSLCGTARDLVTWQRSLVARDLLSERASLALMTPTILSDGNSTNFGYAIQMSWFHDFKSYAYTGSGEGFRARLGYWSLPEVTIVVLANCDAAPVERVEREIARALLGIPLPSSQETALTPEDAARCAGLYQIATTQYRIVLKDGALWFTPPVEPAVRLCHRGNLLFVLETDRDVRVTFHVSEGRADGFTLWRNGFESHARRMD